MDELIEQICAKTGLPQDQARQAAQVAVDFIKQKLPGPLAAQVDSILASQDAANAVTQAMGSLGGMFGNKK